MKKQLGMLLIIVAFISTSCIFGRTSKKVMSYRDGRVFLTHRNEFYNVGELAGSWKRIRVGAHAISFHSSDVGATISTDAFCGPSYEDVPLATLTSQLLGGIEGYDVVSSDEFTLDGRGALRTVAVGRFDGVPLAFDIVVIKKNNCMIDFMCIAPSGKLPLVSEDFEGFYKGFHYE